MSALKLVSDQVSDRSRKDLASAIAMHAGARRDLQVAEQASAAAKQKWWNAEARLELLRKEAPSPGGYLSDDTIAMIASGAACDTDVLDKSAVESGARMKAFENDIRVWQAASVQCDLAVKARAESAAEAKERVDRSARIVLCNSETATRLTDDLEHLQAKVIEDRVALRFIRGQGLNGEMAEPDHERAESLLLQDLSGLERGPVHAAWSAALDTLTIDADAKLPEIAGVA